MKPWEEEWTVSSDFSWELSLPGGDGAVFGVWRGSDGWVGGQPNEAARARLASAAPDMARILLRFEWCLAPGGCPACKNLMPFEHKADCELVAVLRKAGVR